MKRIKKGITITLLISCIFICLMLIFNQKNSYTIGSVKIERDDASVENKNGDIIAYNYYEKPVFHGDSNGEVEINNYFQQRAKDFMDAKKRPNGTEDGKSLDWLHEQLQDNIERYGEEELAVSPLHRSIDCIIMLQNDEYFSSIEYFRLYSTGPRHYEQYGITFSMKTGELVPLNELVDINGNDIRKMIKEYLLNATAISEDTLNHDTIDSFNYYYDYAYDGEFIYFTLNGVTTYQSGNIIIKWNGKFGADFKGEVKGIEEDKETKKVKIT